MNLHIGMRYNKQQLRSFVFRGAKYISGRRSAMIYVMFVYASRLSFFLDLLFAFPRMSRGTAAKYHTRQRYKTEFSHGNCYFKNQELCL